VYAFAVALSVAAGIAGAVQVAVMGRFGEQVGVLPALAFSTAATAVLAVAVLLVARRSLDGFAAAARAPTWMWLGALMGTYIVFTITLVAPRLGTFATIGIFIAGQLACGVVIDRYGLFGLERIGLHWQRALGLVFLAAGAALALRK
jgi:bacterial/archaeal transporter family-2 protein